MAFLIDDASEDSTTDVIRDWCNSSGKGRPILLNKRHGPPGARNVALKLLISEGYQLVLFHDSDCVLERNTVAAHIAAHENSVGTGIIGGPVKSIHSTRVGAADGYASWFTSPPGRSNGKFRFLHLPTCNLSVKTWVFDKTGLFQENLVTGEDVAFCQAARAAGVDIAFAAEAILAHKDRDDLHTGQISGMLVEQGVSAPRGCAAHRVAFCGDRNRGPGGPRQPGDGHCQ